MTMLDNEQEALLAIRRERENLVWINESLSWLRRKFGDRFIAVRDQQVVDSDEDFEALWTRVRALEDADSVTIEYVSAQEYMWIF